MKTYEVNLTTTATIDLWLRVKAKDREHAKEILRHRINNWVSTPERDQPMVSIIEPPLEGHDFTIDDIEVQE